MYHTLGKQPHFWDNKKGLVIFCNQPKLKGLGLIHVAFMTWESTSPI